MLDSMKAFFCFTEGDILSGIFIFFEKKIKKSQFGMPKSII